jgi:hypothetical protein
LLAVADELYTNREYAEAARQYAQAAGALEEPALAARARLGEGMSALQSDNAADGVRALEALVANANAPKSLRIEALFHLAAHADAAGDQAKARGFLDQLEALSPAGMWASRAASLRARLPLEEEEAEETPSVTLPQ